MLVDAAGFVSLTANFGHAMINELLNESSFYPTLRFNTASNPISNIDILRTSYADSLSGVSHAGDRPDRRAKR